MRIDRETTAKRKHRYQNYVTGTIQNLMALSTAPVLQTVENINPQQPLTRTMRCIQIQEARPEPLPTTADAAARSRFVFTIQYLEQSARLLSEQEYNARCGMQKNTANSVEKKKRMRNKSAFISRSTQQNYAKLLTEVLQRSEFERDFELYNCISISQEIQVLHLMIKDLNAQLALFTSPNPQMKAPQGLLDSLFTKESDETKCEALLSSSLYEIVPEYHLQYSETATPPYVHCQQPSEFMNAEQLPSSLDVGDHDFCGYKNVFQ